MIDNGLFLSIGSQAEQRVTLEGQDKDRILNDEEVTHD